MFLLQLSIYSHFDPVLWSQWSGLDVAYRLVKLPPDTYIRVEVSHLKRKLSERCPRIRQISWPIDVLIIIDTALWLNIEVRMNSSVDVNVLQWKREWFFSRRVTFCHWVQRNGGIWSFLTWTWNQFRFNGIQKWVWKWWKWRPFWLSQKIHSTFSSNWVIPYHDGCSQLLISSKTNWFVHRRQKKKDFPFSLVGNTSFAMNLLELISNASIVSNSSMCATFLGTDMRWTTKITMKTRHEKYLDMLPHLRQFGMSKGKRKNKGARGCCAFGALFPDLPELSLRRLFPL